MDWLVEKYYLRDRLVDACRSLWAVVSLSILYVREHQRYEGKEGKRLSSGCSVSVSQHIVVFYGVETNGVEKNSSVHAKLCLIFIHFRKEFKMFKKSAGKARCSIWSSDSGRLTMSGCNGN